MKLSEKNEIIMLQQFTVSIGAAVVAAPPAQAITGAGSATDGSAQRLTATDTLRFVAHAPLPEVHSHLHVARESAGSQASAQRCDRNGNDYSHHYHIGNIGFGIGHIGDHDIGIDIGHSNDDIVR